MKKTFIQYGSRAVLFIKDLIEGIRSMDLGRGDQLRLSRSRNILAYYPSGSTGAIEFRELLSFEERKAFNTLKMDRGRQSSYIYADMGRLMRKQIA